MTDVDNQGISATVPPFALLRPGAINELLDVLRDNIGEAGIQTLDLPRIKVPSGGSLLWPIQDPDGHSSAKVIEAIILAWRDGRLYWKQAMNASGGKIPPDCVSRDAIVGVGDPGGDCHLCPFARFGSSAKGSGSKAQACKSIKQLLLVRENELLPSLLAVPPSSLKPVSQYFIALLSRGLPHWAVTTRISLEKATNDAGIAYGRMVFTAGRVLNPQDRATLAPLHKQMKDMLAPGVIDARDYTSDSEVPF